MIKTYFFVPLTNPKYIQKAKTLKIDHIVFDWDRFNHDYFSAMNARYEYESYRYAHDFVLNLAKSFAVEAIDIASMDIDDEVNFSIEVKRGFDKGYRSKFILHPRQLEYLDEIEYFTQDEIDFARMVSKKINIDDFDAVKIDGKVLEKPHINRIKEILKYAGHGNE